MKLQVAMEYLFIVGIVLAFLIPVWVYTSTSQQRASEDLSLSYGKSAVNKLAFAIDLVYSQGPPAKVTENVYFPSGIESNNMDQKTLVLRIKTSSGVNDVWAPTKANLVGALPEDEGHFLFSIESINESYVSITYDA